MQTSRRLATLAGLAALVAALAAPTPAAATDPTAAAPLPLRLTAGTHPGYRIGSTGTITLVKTITLTKPATVTAVGRKTVPSRGIFLKVGSGALLGTWVRESSTQYVPGKVGLVTLAPARAITFPVDATTGRRTYLGYRFSTTGGLISTTVASLAAAATWHADQAAAINGRSYARMADGPLRGWWAPVKVSTALGVACRAGNRTTSRTMSIVARVSGADPGEVSLTFDMGGRLDPAASILRQLLVERACTTVFPTGDAIATTKGAAAMAIVKAHPELFEVGNHTQHHCNLRDGGGGAACPATRPSASFVGQELAEAAAAIEAATGQSPVPYWRPPYGASDTQLRTVAASAGYPKAVMWAKDTIDWRAVDDGGPTALDIARTIEATPDGGVVLMHLGGWNTLDALPFAFATLRADGRTATTISGLLD